MEELNKVFYTPGDIVTIKHNIPNKPVMLVKGKETKMILDRSDKSANHFVGIKCFWFTEAGMYQEQIFSTKDLVHIKSTGI